MEVYVHKLFSRASVVNPMLFQCRQLSQWNVLNQSHVKKTQHSHLRLPPLLNVKPSYAQHITFFSHASPVLNQVNTSNTDSDGGASKEQLAEVYQHLRETLPKFFGNKTNTVKLHRNIVLEDRIRGKTFNGLMEYQKQMALLQVYSHFKFAYVNLEILKMTQHPEDSSIKVRWRIMGISNLSIIHKMIVLRKGPGKVISEDKAPWIDGFSTLYVNNEGFIVRHIADKVMPDEDKQPNVVEKAVEKLGEMPKLALFVNLSSDIVPAVV